ncbi:MAG: hypothetical protein D6744_16030 [Planctomycetota bacterium]|nr:MAG: hypothetical protein D6744_16030 [Planctomycetota bacterium]
MGISPLRAPPVACGQMRVAGRRSAAAESVGRSALDLSTHSADEPEAGKPSVRGTNAMRAFASAVVVAVFLSGLVSGCRRASSDDGLAKQSSRPAATDADEAKGDEENGEEVAGSDHFKVPGDPTTLWMPGQPHNVFIGRAPDNVRAKPAPTSPSDAESEHVSASGDERRQGGVLVREAERMQPGYTLLVVHRAAKAVLIDAEGAVVRVWSDPGAQMWDGAELLPGGDLVVVGAETTSGDVKGVTDESRYCARFDWDGDLLWRKNNHAHHDIAAGSGERLLTLTYELRIEPAVHESVELRDDAVTVLSAEGEPIDSMTLYGPIAAKPEMFPLLPVEPSTVGGRTWVNLFQTSSVAAAHVAGLAADDPMYASTAVVVTFRHQNRVAIFDLERRELLWAWGQNELDGPNDAQVLANGHVLVFDDGVNREASRVLEIDPAANKIVWTYQSDPPSSFHTTIKGSAQRLANGNTLITDSDSGEIFEIDAGGEIVWRYLGTDRSRGKRAPIATARRYDPALVDPLLD